MSLMLATKGPTSLMRKDDSLFPFISLWLHELQHTRLPCLSLSPGVCANSCPLSQSCHPTISSSVASFFSCPLFFPASRSMLLLMTEWPSIRNQWPLWYESENHREDIQLTKYTHFSCLNGEIVEQDHSYSSRTFEKL